MEGGMSSVWVMCVVLLCLHGGSDSQTQTEIMTTIEYETGTMTATMGTSPPPTKTPPPPPPPSLPPPPPTTISPGPTPEPTPSSPTTRLPPPPPPPSPPPPPPSSIAPPSSTPVPPTSTALPTVRFTTTVAIEPTQSQPRTTTRRVTEEPQPIEPNPIAVELGSVEVILNIALEDFNEENFRVTIAREVNMYCAENPCKGEGKTVEPIHVVIVQTTTVQVEGSRRKLLQTQQTQVRYYVQDPFSSSNVMMTTEEQQAFLADETVQETLKEDIPGFVGAAPVYDTEIIKVGLEGWEIALITIGAVAGAVLLVALIYFITKDNEKSKDGDVELQESNKPSNVVNNGLAKEKGKVPVEEKDFSSQVKYKEILAETGYEPPPKCIDTKPVGNEDDETGVEDRLNGNAIVVTAEITSSSSSASSEQDDTENHTDLPPPTYETVAEADKADQQSKDPEEEKNAEEAVGELDNLIADQTKEPGPVAFENPAFTTSTETDELGISKTAL